MRRVDGVLPSEVLSAKCHVAWTRSGRLVFSKVGTYGTGTYTIHTLYVPRGARPGYPLVAAPKEARPRGGTVPALLRSCASAMRHA